MLLKLLLFKPVPLRVKLKVLSSASLFVKLMVLLKVPVVVGEKFTEKVVDSPTLRVVSVKLEAKLKPEPPPREMAPRVKSFVPWLRTRKVWVWV